MRLNLVSTWWLILMPAFLTAPTAPAAMNFTDVKAVAAGSRMSFALRSDGTVWAWGSNETGSLGDGTLTSRAAPVRVSGLSDVVAISGGLALKADGTVWEWGANLSAFKVEAAINKTPVLVTELDGVVAVAGGWTSSLALKANGTVWAWGVNGWGQLEDGLQEPRPRTPVPVDGITDVVALAGAFQHSLALRRDGTVWAWGANRYGLLGDGLTTPPSMTLPDLSRPERVAGLVDIVAVAAGWGHGLALQNNGTVWAWGFNGHGQLGDGTTQNRTEPVRVSGLAEVVKITAGNAHSIAVKRDGSVWAWGSNASGQLGDGTTTDRLMPVIVSTLSEIAAAAGGGAHSLALKRDGTVWAFGDNTVGQLGDGEPLKQFSKLDPLQIREVDGVAKIAAGGSHNLALKYDGTVWSWGDNSAGQLGDGTRTVLGRSKPAAVSGMTGVVAIAAGGGSNLAVTGDGEVWGWGVGVNGLPFDTVYELSPAPVPVLTGLKFVAFGGAYNLAVKDDGSLWEWGYKWTGSFDMPYTHLSQVTGLAEVNSASAALAQNLALKRDGTVWEWGKKGPTPVRVAGLTDVIGVAAGCTVWWESCHSLALERDGTVWAWGDNDSGQLGDGTTSGRAAPVPVSGLDQVVAIAARSESNAHSIALKSDRTVWEWPTAGEFRPVQVAGLTDIIAVAEGTAHSLALKRDGTVWGWGSGYGFALGVDPFIIRMTPVQVVGPASE